uniref:Uncharacterized LOC102081728 n=1 Tax=Oreochromis niloticus TaxID=8128 RepID=A0A669DPJ5_ORENI
MTDINPHAKKPHGLVNQGATCYLNSVLQVLFMTKDFREAVTRDSDPLLKHLFETLEKKTATTSRITQKLKIQVCEQRDAAEYFEKILSDTSVKASQIFQGELTHKNTCCECKTDTNTSDPFWSLPLALESDNNEYNVEKELKDFFQEVCIDGDNQLYCEICDAKAGAKIKLEMTRYPDVLTLLLKRFKFDYRYQEHVKIKRAVTVPDTLQIPENQTYELYAFVEHFGDLRSGHYTVTIKSQDDEHDDRWYNFDDTFVRLVSLIDFFPLVLLVVIRWQQSKMAANQTGLRTSLTGFVRVRMRVQVLGLCEFMCGNTRWGHMSSCVFNLI